MSDTKTAATSIACLTAGVDVMKNHLIVGIYGWSNDGKPTKIDGLEIRDGHPYNTIWLSLQKALSGYRMCPDGELRKVEAICIDAGAYRAQEVHSFVRTTKLPRTYAVKLVNNSLPHAWPKKPGHAPTRGPVAKFYAVNINRILAKLASVAGIEAPSDDLVLAAAARESLLAERAELARGQLDENGDGDVRTAELARDLNQHRELPEGSLHLTPGSDVASADDRVEFDVMHWGDDRNRFYFDHTLTIGLGRWYLEVSLSTLNRLRPFAEREDGFIADRTWRAGALGFEIELERYAS